MYTHVFICTHIYINIYIYICIYTYVFIYVCTYLYIYELASLWCCNSGFSSWYRALYIKFFLYSRWQIGWNKFLRLVWHIFLPTIILLMVIMDQNPQISWECRYENESFKKWFEHSMPTYMQSQAAQHRFFVVSHIYIYHVVRIVHITVCYTNAYTDTQIDTCMQYTVTCTKHTVVCTHVRTLTHSHTTYIHTHTHLLPSDPLGERIFILSDYVLILVPTPVWKCMSCVWYVIITWMYVDILINLSFS